MSCLGLKRPKFVFFNSLFSCSKTYSSECNKILQVPQLFSVDSRILEVILTYLFEEEGVLFFLSMHVCEEALFHCSHFIYCT